MSRLLVHEEEFYKLLQLCQSYVLPELVRRAKVCRKQGVAEMVL